MTLKRSVKRISSSAIPRMISVALWEPQFPPVSISIGMKDTRRGMAANAFSYLVMIVPVMMEVNIKIKSHGIRFFACWRTDVSKYVFSLGLMAAIFVISSVASSTITSIASSNVTIPTMRPSWSITGSASRSYFVNSCATCSWSACVYTEMISVSIRSLIGTLSSVVIKSFALTIPTSFLRSVI